MSFHYTMETVKAMVVIELWLMVTYVNKGGSNVLDSRDSGSTPSTITPSGSSSDTDDDDDDEEDEDWDSEFHRRIAVMTREPLERQYQKVLFWPIFKCMLDNYGD
nr:uncharacterized protein LOC123759120 [Procambarus clarkii]